MKRAAMPFEKLKPIRLILLDVDGILTDGLIQLIAGPGGAPSESKSFHAHDGQGLIFAARLGYEVGIVTSRESRVVAHRAEELGIRHVFQGVKQKLPVVKQFLADYKFHNKELLYMGDDLPDLPVLLAAGFSATVPEAPPAIRERVDYVTDLSGGRGAVREVLEILFKAQNKWNGLMEKFL